MAKNELERLMEPFPVRGTRVSDGSGLPDHRVPRAYALIAYKSFKKHFGELKTIEEIEKAGGFEFPVFLDLLCGGNGDGSAFARNHLPEHSLKGQLPIIQPGTKEFDDEMKFIRDQEERARQKSGRVVTGYGTTGDVWKK